MLQTQTLVSDSGFKVKNAVLRSARGFIPKTGIHYTYNGEGWILPESPKHIDNLYNMHITCICILL